MTKRLKRNNRSRLSAYIYMTYTGQEGFQERFGDLEGYFRTLERKYDNFMYDLQFFWRDVKYVPLNMAFYPELIAFSNETEKWCDQFEHVRNLFNDYDPLTGKV